MNTALKCENINLANKMYRICNPPAGTGGGRLWRTTETMAVWKGQVDSHTLDVGNIVVYDNTEYTAGSLNAIIPAVAADINNPLDTDWSTISEIVDTQPFSLFFDTHDLLGNLGGGSLTGGKGMFHVYTSAASNNLRIRITIDGTVALDVLTSQQKMYASDGSPGLTGGSDSSAYGIHCSGLSFAASSYKIDLCRDGDMSNKHLRVWGSYTTSYLFCKTNYTI